MSLVQQYCSDITDLIVIKQKYILLSKLLFIVYHGAECYGLS